MPEKLTGPAPASRIEVRRADETRTVMAKDEMASIYFWTDRLVFVVSVIPPGGRSTLDPGHKDADEICYVVEGTLVLEFPELQRWERLSAGDAIQIPQDEPHTVINPTDKAAVSIWATAPHLGYELADLTGVPAPDGKGPRRG